MSDTGKSDNGNERTDSLLNAAPAQADHSDSPTEKTERYNQQTERNREKFIYAPLRWIFEKLEHYHGVVLAIATVVIAWLTWSLAVDSSRQAGIADGQLDAMRTQQTIMQGQLDAMKQESRAWVGPSKIYFVDPNNNEEPLKVLIEYRNFGRTPATR